MHSILSPSIFGCFYVYFDVLSGNRSAPLLNCPARLASLFSARVFKGERRRKTRQNTVPANVKYFVTPPSFQHFPRCESRPRPTPPHNINPPLPPPSPLLGSHSFSLSKHFASRCHNREFHPPSPGGSRETERRRDGETEGWRDRETETLMRRKSQNSEIFECRIFSSRRLLCCQTILHTIYCTKPDY